MFATADECALDRAKKMLKPLVDAPAEEERMAAQEERRTSVDPWTGVLTHFV